MKLPFCRFLFIVSNPPFLILCLLMYCLYFYEPAPSPYHQNCTAAHAKKATAALFFGRTVPFFLFTFLSSAYDQLFFLMAASTTWPTRTDVVTDPTPPGTGVIASTIGSAFAYATSPQSFPSSFTLIPTSITVWPARR